MDEERLLICRGTRQVIKKRQLASYNFIEIILNYRLTIAQLRSHYSYNHDTVILTNVLISGAQNCP